VDDLREAVLAGAEALAGADAASASGGLGRPDAIVLERPPKADFGDYATNAALLLAPSLGIAPREVAERLGAELGRRLGGRLRRFEVAGPGFLNLFLADSWLLGALARVLGGDGAFGAGGAQPAERILVEFVSANPTGPMHVGHARNAAYGDSLARVLAFHGHEVEREFYVNDAGSQVRALGESIRAVAREEEVPEGGYRGDYVRELAGEIDGAAARDPGELGQAAVGSMIARMQATLQSFAVQGFDHWQYESALHSGDPSPVAHTLATLEEHGHTYREDGALWLRTTDYGDDKDRVLVRSSGEHTYFASDIAYHQDKRERGFERQIDVWGADHHGYLPRMRAAYAALGGDPDHLEMLTMQLVHLVRRGERAQMSKRAGVRHARGPRFRGRRRRGALVSAVALARHRDRPRPRPRARPVPRESRLLRAVRARPHRLRARARGARARSRGAEGGHLRARRRRHRRGRGLERGHGRGHRRGPGRRSAPD
jgi:arginyl-tRNA synthetase